MALLVVDVDGVGVVVDDVELIELLDEMQTNAIVLPRVVRMMLGDAQYAAFKDANRNDRGRVPVEVLGEFFEAADATVGNQQASSGS